MTETATPPPSPAAPQGDSVAEMLEQTVQAVASVDAQGRPQIRVDPAMVADMLQRKNAQLMSQIVYDNAVLETALETAHRRIQELETDNKALRDALGA